MKKIWKRTLAVLLAVLMAGGALPLCVTAAVYSGECGAEGSNVTWNLDTSTGTLTISGTGEMADYEYYGDNSAPWYCYSYRSSIYTVTIDSGVESIGNYAFYGCTSLTSVTIPESVTDIWNSAFRNCTSLTSVTIPKSVMSIGNYAFEYCQSLTSVTIPDSVTSIGRSAFGFCTGLTSLTFNAVRCADMNYYNIVFTNCTSLNAITIGERVETIPAYAFYNCTGITEITIPDSVTDVGQNAFYNCSRLSRIKLSANLRHIGVDAFFGTALYTDAGNWTDGVLYIDNSLITTDRILSGTYSVREGTVCLADSALNGCGSLTALEIPASVLGIGDGTFAGCGKLTEIRVAAANPAFCADDSGVLYDKEKTVLICCPASSSVDRYAVPDSVVRIGDSAFCNCQNLLSVELSDSVTQIGAASFSDCSNLTTVRFPAELSAIGEKAFYDCRKLTSVELPDTVSEIGESAFYQCSRIGSIRIPQSVTIIRAGAFSSCGLKSITLGENITTVEDGAFSYNPIRNITFGPSVKRFGGIVYGGASAYSGLESVCYSGTVEQWLATDFGSRNSTLTSAPRYYHTHNDSMPTETRYAKEATCYDDGYSGDVVYLPCGAVKEAGKTLPATGHDWDEGAVTREPTCTWEGTILYTCKNDPNHTYRESIPSLGGHDYVTTVTEATCEQWGGVTVVCSRCGQHDWEQESRTPSLGHDWDDGVVTQEASCTKPGIKLYTCKRDPSHTREEYTPASGHRFGAWQQTKAPTAEAEGEAQRRCMICGAVETITLAKLSESETLTLNKTSVTLNYKDTETLTASEPVVWSSSNEKVVQVDPATGKLTAVGKGTATVTAHSVQGGKEAACTVTVKYTFLQILIRIFLLGFLWY